MNKVMITGATGMIGKQVLDLCLKSDEITSVIAIGRNSTKLNHPKLTEIIWDDFLCFKGLEEEFKNINTVFYCLGVYTGAVSNKKFKEITTDYTIAFAEMLKDQSPKATFCFLSGAGADLKEKSGTPFAKFKGMAENGLIRQQFGALYIFRPSYIYPVVKRKEPNLMYRVTRSLYPMIRLFGYKWSITATELAEAMFQVMYNNPGKTILENQDILSFLNEKNA